MATTRTAAQRIQHHDEECATNSRHIFTNHPTNAAVALIKDGNAFLCREDIQSAFERFDAAQAVLTVLLKNHHPLHASCPITAKYIELEDQVLEATQLAQSVSLASELTTTTYPPDIYEEDECDIGPRMIRTPIVPDHTSENDVQLLGVIILFNKGLLFHKLGNQIQSKKMFEMASYTIQTMLGYTMIVPSTTFLLLAMRSHNNLGVLSYLERGEGVAVASFEAAAQFGKHLTASLFPAHSTMPSLSSYKLDYATVLSNWCRVNWMRDDIANTNLPLLEEILQIRSDTLSWDHADIAAANYNIAVAEYSRHNSSKAIVHFKKYLSVAKHHTDHGLKDLDSVPALIYLLLIENEDKCTDHPPSQDLVRGLRALQEKRQEVGSNCVEVACVLNYVGTLLFHQQDFQNALIFFCEELRLEDKTEKLVTKSNDHNIQHCQETTSISVTCNNIGRILQELGKFQEAISYYHRALQPVYGDVGARLRNYDTTTLKSLTSNFPSSANLYSTVWYNLGLIHDKLGGYNEAISAFEVSLHLRKILLGNNHSDIACLLYNIGVLQMEQQRLTDASISFREALSIRRVTAAGRLNDRHVVKTLVKLAALHRDKGNVHGALDIAKEILAIQKTTTEYDDITRAKEIGATLRFTSELHHSVGNVNEAVIYSTQSVNEFRIATVLGAQDQTLDIDQYYDPIVVKERVANIEQFALTLLLLGSLYHEDGDPLSATTVLQEAATLVQSTISSSLSLAITIPSTIFALQEVTAMLASFQCAPMA